VWDCTDGYDRAVKLAGEYEEDDKWLVLDVEGHVIVDSRPVGGEDNPKAKGAANEH